jgi:hypothetical protein
MKIITNYGRFIKESIETNESNDVFEVLDLLKNVPTEDIIELRNSLEELVETSENLREGFFMDIIDKLKIKFQKSIDQRIWKYLINRKNKFYVNLIDKMNIFDLTSLDDIFKNYPGFDLISVYLAGGMDKAKDVGAGWRIIVEHEFEKYPGKKTGLPEINLKEFGKVDPKRVVDGIYLDMFIENPEKIKKMYNKPLVLNPVRKEVDRTKDKDFAQAAIQYKTFGDETEPEEYEPTMTNIRRTLSSTIEPGDEHLVNLSDMVFLGLNTAAAAGTYGELQTQSFMNKPIFVWMTDDEWSFSDFSMWTFPHISKLARNEEEMKVLVNTIINYIK